MPQSSYRTQFSSLPLPELIALMKRKKINFAEDNRNALEALRCELENVSLSSPAEQIRIYRQPDFPNHLSKAIGALEKLLNSDPETLNGRDPALADLGITVRVLDTLSRIAWDQANDALGKPSRRKSSKRDSIERYEALNNRDESLDVNEIKIMLEVICEKLAIPTRSSPTVS